MMVRSHSKGFGFRVVSHLDNWENCMLGVPPSSAFLYIYILNKVGFETLRGLHPTLTPDNLPF